MTYRLYIGANNVTKEVETDLIESTLNKYFDGYTVENCTGYWLGQKENSVAVTIETNKDVMPVIAELKEVLKQDAIAYQKVQKLNFA